MTPPLLEIRDATKIYGVHRLPRGRWVMALDAFSLRLEKEPARITTIAGESGSGKTTLANAVLGFTRLTSGHVFYLGRDIATLKGRDTMNYRRQVQAIFQNPYDVYNPFYRIKHVFDLIIRRFRLAAGTSEAREKIKAALKVVGLRGEEVLSKHPHQLSGGQRQRIMMARALMMNPSLIIADEPVSMVDASLRAMILDIMLRLRDEQNISFLYITHDLSTAYQIGDEIYVLYQGGITEIGPAEAVITSPKHPYVQQLVNSVPVPDPRKKWDTQVQIPDESHASSRDRGCRYYGRCPDRMDRCRTAPPPLIQVGDRRRAACFLYDGE